MRCLAVIMMRIDVPSTAVPEPVQFREYPKPTVLEDDLPQVCSYPWNRRMRHGAIRRPVGQLPALAPNVVSLQAPPSVVCRSTENSLRAVVTCVL